MQDMKTACFYLRENGEVRRNQEMPINLTDKRRKTTSCFREGG